MEPVLEPSQIHPETLQETPPEVVLNIYENVTGLIAANGWYLLLAGAVCAVLGSWLRPQLERWQSQREEQMEAARRHKNPDLYRTQQLALEVARQRLQADHQAKAALAAERAKERAAERVRERLSKQSHVSTGRKLVESSAASQEYNPLMGGGSSSGFRPSRRPCPGGGCG